MERESSYLSLQKLDEMHVLIYNDNPNQAKLAKFGTAGIWVGLVDGHLVSTFWVLNSKARKVNLSCNVPFLSKSHGEWNKVDNHNNCNIVSIFLKAKAKKNTISNMTLKLRVNEPLRHS